MATQKITYDNKVAINVDSTIPDINKCNASDLNQIKSVVNNNADEIPTKTSQLTNDSNFITPTDYATTQKGGVFKTETTYGTGMTNGMLRGVIAQDGQTFDGGSFLDASLVSKGSLKKWVDYKGFIDKDVNNLTNYTKTSDLSAVATSGSYTDLSNKPTIPDMSETYGTSTTDGYSEAYLNNKLVKVSSTQPTDNSGVWVEQSKNLFDKDNVNVLNAYIDSNGKITNETTNRTIYISILPNTTYTISKLASQRFRVGTYQNVPANDSTTSNFTANITGTSTSITTGANDNYLAVWLYNSGLDTLTYQQIIDSLQIELGSTATTYEAFKPQVIYSNNNGTYEKLTDTINVGTEINSANRVNMLYSHNLLNIDELTFRNGYYDNTGTYQEANTIGMVEFIDVKPSSTYTISVNTTLATLVSVEFNGNSFIRRNIQGNVKFNTFITSNTTNKLAIFFQLDNSTTITTDILKSWKPMLNIGNEVLDYEPYITPSINVDGEEIYNSNIMNYSTNEQVIGKWIDGKPIYRVSAILNEISTVNTEVSRTINAINVDKIINVEGFMYQTGGTSIGACRPLQYYNSSTGQNNFCFASVYDTTKIIVNLKSSWVVVPYLTLYYTKTTD